MHGLSCIGRYHPITCRFYRVSYLTCRSCNPKTISKWIIQKHLKRHLEIIKTIDNRSQMQKKFPLKECNKHYRCKRESCYPRIKLSSYFFFKDILIREKTKYCSWKEYSEKWSLCVGKKYRCQTERSKSCSEKIFLLECESLTCEQPSNKKCQYQCEIHRKVYRTSKTCLQSMMSASNVLGKTDALVCSVSWYLRRVTKYRSLRSDISK